MYSLIKPLDKNPGLILTLNWCGVLQLTLSCCGIQGSVAFPFWPIDPIVLERFSVVRQMGGGQPNQWAKILATLKAIPPTKYDIVSPVLSTLSLQGQD